MDAKIGDWKCYSSSSWDDSIHCNCSKSHLFNTGFITYLANAFTISTEEFKTWLIGEEFSSIRYLLQ